MLETKINAGKFTVSKISNNNVKNKNENKMLKTEVVIGLSAVALGTLAGICYFTKRGAGKKINSQMFSDIKKTMNEVPQFFESKTGVSYTSERIQTMSQNTKWNIYNTNEVQVDSQAVSKNDKCGSAKKDWRERRKDEVIPGIIRQISQDIKEYMRICGIDRKNNKVNPAKLDEILTKAVGKENVQEHPYLENGKHGFGRKKEYKSPNGRIYVLETHDSPKGVVTRLYMNCKDKHLRAYLHADGTFRLNSYTSDEAHFYTTAKGKRWMVDSKFLNKSAQPEKK